MIRLQRACGVFLLLPFLSSHSVRRQLTGAELPRGEAHGPPGDLQPTANEDLKLPVQVLMSKFGRRPFPGRASG